MPRRDQDQVQRGRDGVGLPSARVGRACSGILKTGLRRLMKTCALWTSASAACKAVASLTDEALALAVRVPLSGCRHGREGVRVTRPPSSCRHLASNSFRQLFPSPHAHSVTPPDTFSIFSHAQTPLCDSLPPMNTQKLLAPSTYHSTVPVGTQFPLTVM